MSPRVERLCANPGCQHLGLHLCSGCGEEIYCSKECQKAHWVTHKPKCHVAKPKGSALASLDSLSVKQIKNALKAKAATLDKQKRKYILDEMEKMVEKPSLVKFASEFITVSDAEALLSPPQPASSSGAGATDARHKRSSSSSSGNSSSSQSSSSGGGAMHGGGRGNKNNPPMPTPDQLRQQAMAMRANPAQVRSLNPVLANMTDEQIRQYADHLEKASSDPNMMKEIEKMSRMSQPEREQVAHIQEGLTGNRPMDDAWIDSTIKSFRSNPGMFKTMLKGKGSMFGGVSDQQIEAFIDNASQISPFYLKVLFKIFCFIGQSTKPVMDTYATFDKYTIGIGRYLLLALVAAIVYYWAVFTMAALYWIVGMAYWLFTGKKLAGTAIAAVGSAAAKTAASAAASALSGAKSASSEASTAANTAAAAVAAAAAKLDATVGATGTAESIAETAARAKARVKAEKVDLSDDEFIF